ncbi:MAG: peptidoglycan-binding domain-containing protein [Microcystaceae cyanobacterium]
MQRVYLKVFDGKYQGQPTFWNWQCSPEIIQELKSRNIQVYGWGYHYGTADIARQIVKVRQALNCGLDGYIVDLEKEVEDPSRHTNVDKLLSALRIIVKGGTFGYTSFGNPRLHSNVPWKILDKYCDFALPQIYFEKFTFKPTTPEEVKDCLDAYKNLGLKKPILPIWGSESDTAKPATVAELQDYLNYYSGSSIWRIPKEGERGEAWNLMYSGFELPTLRRNLRQGRIGDDVKAVQKVMNARGYNAGTVDGDFGSQTEVAVRAFQKEAGLSVDGEVGKLTWTALGGKFNG